jgi:hypothetical protein
MLNFLKHNNLSNMYKVELQLLNSMSNVIFAKCAIAKKLSCEHEDVWMGTKV